MFTIIFGPTATGKTAKALQLAAEQKGNILSFDSRQIYKGMDIGTGKDIPLGYSPQNWKEDPSVLVYQGSEGQPLIFGLDIILPTEPFSIRHFYEYVQSIIQWHRENNIPLIIVGGSWPYARVLVYPPDSLFDEVNPDQRDALQTLSLEELQTHVQQEKPDNWARLNDSDRANPRRLIRALETSPHETLPPPLILEKETRFTFLDQEMPVIERAIRERIESRLEAGMIEETKRLMVEYADWSSPAFSATGYLPIQDYIEGMISLEEAKERWFLQERQYAKRQKTWLKKLV